MTPKTTRTIAIDPDILAAAEEHAKTIRESTNQLIQRAVRELLEKAQAWPPKEK